MCNCKGWDSAFFEEGTTVVPHFCRVLGDCCHSDNTLEEAADEVARAYEREYEWYADAMNREIVEHSPEHLDKLRDLVKAWRDRTHPDYLYYAKGEE